VKRLLAALVLLGTGCNARVATVRVSIPDLDGVETPVPGPMVTYLPYDRDSILDAIEARAAPPRPHVAELDSLRALFRAPFTTVLRLTAAKTRLEAEREALTSQGTSGGRLSTVRDSLAALEPALVRARAALDTARIRYWPAMDSLGAIIRTWSDRTFASYDSSARTLPGRRVANPVADTTDALGWATTRLTDGRWWVTARAIDPTDPNADWYWNAPIVGDTVLLDSRSGRRRPRY
jgi:hypothetical protein